MELKLCPEPFEGNGANANLASEWRRRGALLAEASLAQYPLIDWGTVKTAAACFAIADGLTAYKLSEPDNA